MKNKPAILGGRPVLNKPLPPYNSIGREETRAALRVMKTGILSEFVGRAGDQFLGGKYVKELEQRMCRKFKVKYAVSFNSATTALEASVAAVGVKRGDEVITTPYTMSATATAILLNGATPVFADIDPDSFCLDPKSVEKLITKKTKAIMTVNLFGGSSDFPELLRLAKKYKLKLLEDNAQSIGAKYKDKFLGTIGDAGVFSFNFHKTLQCGEGGVMVTNDKDVAFRAQLIRNHAEVVVHDLGKEGDAYADILGNNYRLSEIHAAIAIEQFKKLDKLNRPRVELADYLSSQLKKISWLEPRKVMAQSTHVYYVYPFKFFIQKAGFSRKTFARAMAAEGFLLGEGYVEPLYLLPFYQRGADKFKYKKGICPVTEHFYEKELLYVGICRTPLNKKHIDLFMRAIKKIDENKAELAVYEKRSGR